MLNGLWFGMIVVSFICALATGQIQALSLAAANGADKAIRLLISMAGVMCLWSGMMKIAERSGLTQVIARVLSPVLCRLMPDYAKDSPAMRAVCANVTANILGLGNAATPLGVLAMRELQKENKHPEAPNHSMILFVILNTASIQLIPTTMAALRQAAGSTEPYAILPHIWLSSAGALLVGLTAARLFSCCHHRKTIKARRTGGVRLWNT